MLHFYSGPPMQCLSGVDTELIVLRVFAAGNIRDAFADVEIQAAATRSIKPFFHAYVRLPESEALDRAQWEHVADRIEKRLGFADQPRAVAFHHAYNPKSGSWGLR